MAQDPDPARPRVVFAVYELRSPDDEDRLLQILARHVATLQHLELATDRAPILVRSSSGAYVEIFEWASEEAAERAHDHPDVVRLWESIAAVAQYRTLASLPEAHKTFTHYEPVELQRQS